MHRFAPLAAAMAVALLALLAACDDSAEPPAAPETIAVGTLPGELPTAPTARQPTTGDDGGTGVDVEPDGTDRPSDETAPETTDEPETSPPDTEPDGPTVFAVELDGLVEDECRTTSRRRCCATTRGACASTSHATGPTTARSRRASRTVTRHRRSPRRPTSRRSSTATTRRG